MKTTRLLSVIPLVALSAAALILAGCDSRPQGVQKATVVEAPTNAAAPAGVTGDTATAVAPVQPEIPAGELATYTLDAKADIRWTGFKIVGKHSGWFSLFDGTCKFAGTDPLSGQFDCTIETDSCETDNDTLTPIVKKESFFWCEKYPTMTFKSAGVAKGKEEGIYTVTGDLTIRGITKRISFDSKIWFEEENKLMRMTSEFYVDRKDWEIIYKYGVGDSVLKDDVLIKLDLYATKQS